MKRCITNEDYEFNARVRKAGGKIWLDPSIRSVYFARSTLLELSAPILALWFLEVAYASPLPQYSALEAGSASVVCYSACWVLACFSFFLPLAGMLSGS